MGTLISICMMACMQSPLATSARHPWKKLLRANGSMIALISRRERFAPGSRLAPALHSWLPGEPN